MSIADSLITLLCYLIQHLLINLLPADAPLYPLSTFIVALQGVRTDLIYCLSGWTAIFPMVFLLTLLRVIITAELSLFSFKIIKFAINVFRGSGA